MSMDSPAFADMLGKRLIHGVPTTEMIGKPLEYIDGKWEYIERQIDDH